MKKIFLIQEFRGEINSSLKDEGEFLPKIICSFLKCSNSLGKSRQHLRELHFFLKEPKEPTIARAVDKRQTIETLINEEALLLAKYLRDERKSWTPRIAVL